MSDYPVLEAECVACAGSGYARAASFPPDDHFVCLYCRGTGLWSGERVIRMPPRENPGPLVSDAEREAVVQQLQADFMDGRLTADEFEERQAAAYAARRQSALDATLEGLPKRPAPEPAKDWGVIWVNAMSLLTLTAVIVAGLVAISMTVTALGL